MLRAANPVGSLLKCANCGAEFRNRDSQQRYCGKPCRCRAMVLRAIEANKGKKAARKIWAAAHYQKNRDKIRAAVKQHSRTPTAMERERARSARRRREERRQFLARMSLNAAVRRGEILRRPCRDCGDPNSHGHHPDYEKPLEVIWLCPAHHAAEHRREINVETVAV